MTDTLRIVLALALALVGLAALVQLAWAHLSTPSLRDAPPLAEGPPVSIIVAARNEARHIGAAVRSLLAQRYSPLEIIVVDDRSTDATGALLATMAREHPELRVVTVRELPDGWLGKNHALHAGASAARGEWLLFVDADVVLDTHAVARAVRMVSALRLDHLAVAPDLVLPTWPLALVVNYFMMWFVLYLRPWRARDPRSRAFVGIGAFNLVRASSFRGVGGLTRIALRPDDDIMLGKVLKQGGARQSLASADGVARVEWYSTLPELARGFRKNAFAGLRYSYALVLFTLAGNLVLAVWPFIAVGITQGAERLLYLVAAASQVVAYAGPAVVRRTRPWLAALYPVAAVLFVGILAAAVLRTMRRGGIEWRDTFYPLERLRANRV